MPSASSCLTLNLAGREKVEIQNVRYDEEGHMILDEQNAGDLLRVFQKQLLDDSSLLFRASPSKRRNNRLLSSSN